MALLLIDTLLHYRKEQKFKLHEFVVMPSHIHLLLTVHGTCSIEKAIQFVKGGFSFRAKKELGFNGDVWQAGFSESQQYTVPEYEARRQYIHLNPVRDGLATESQLFPFSSASGNFEMDARPLHLRG